MAIRRVRAIRPVAPMPIAPRTSGQGASLQGRPSDAGTASAVSATPATAPSCLYSAGSATAAATVSSNALKASSQPD
jgi:hypothetical protein